MGTLSLLISLCILPLGLTSGLNEPRVNVHVQLFNKCAQTIWPAFKGKNFQPTANGGLKLESLNSTDVYLPIGWTGQIWARTACSNNMTCGTGSCGNKLECDGKGPTSPATIAFLQFNRAGSDYYYVSFLQGHNVPITIRPLGSTFAKNCTSAGECRNDMNENCPKELRYWYNGSVQGCLSACDKFHDEHYCCTGGADNMFECNDQSFPVNFPGWFKLQCHKSLTFKYDLKTSNKTEDQESPIYSCSGSGNDTRYMISFC